MSGDEFYFKAFWDLSTCRQIGMGQGPIPWDKMIEYGHVAGLDDDMTDVLVGVIRAMDAAYLKWEDAQRPAS